MISIIFSMLTDEQQNIVETIFNYMGNMDCGFSIIQRKQGGIVPRKANRERDYETFSVNCLLW